MRVRVRVNGNKFPSEVSWLKHVEGDRCKKMEDMSEKELRRRRVTRATAAAKRGEKIFDVEPVEVKSCSGEVAKTVWELSVSRVSHHCEVHIRPAAGDQQEDNERRLEFEECDEF